MKPALFLLVAAWLPALPLQAAPGAAVLTDDTYRLPPGEWRWVRFEIRQRPATAECRFRTLEGGDVRAELVSRSDLDLIRQHKSHDSLTFTDSLPIGGFSRYIEEPGQYAAVVENTGSHPVNVHLTVALSFNTAKPASRYLSPTRRLTVILVSFAMFFAIVTLSTRALLRAMNRP